MAQTENWGGGRGGHVPQCPPLPMPMVLDWDHVHRCVEWCSISTVQHNSVLVYTVEQWPSWSVLNHVSMTVHAMYGYVVCSLVLRQLPLFSCWLLISSNKLGEGQRVGHSKFSMLNVYTLYMWPCSQALHVRCLQYEIHAEGLGSFITWFVCMRSWHHDKNQWRHI